MEDEYIEKVLLGDVDAFRYFLTTYKDMAFNIAISIIKDEQYAEEIVQDSFMKAFNGLKSFDRRSKFKTWFYRIIVNESFQRLKKMKKEFKVVEHSEEVREMQLGSNDENKSNRFDQVKKSLSLLSSNERLVINLFYLEDYSLKEIVHITKWKLENTKVLLHRARKKIRLHVEKSKNK